MYGFTALVIFVLDIVAVVDCVQSSMDTGRKLLWILLILLLPFLGMLLYFLMAKPRRRGLA